MRHFERFRLPHGTKTRLLTALAHYPWRVPLAQAEWRQTLLSDLLGEQAAHATMTAVLQRAAQVLGQPWRAQEFSGVLHWGSAQEVPRHADNLAKTCFLIPLRSTKTLAFFEGDQQCLLANKRLIRFNDFEDHGLSNPQRGHFCLLTLSRDRV